MSPELFKYKPYSYKSDIWALGCVLYEICNLKHAFTAQSLNGLAVKILKGNYMPISTMYSKNLRNLIMSMLNINPKKRPTINEILEKPIVKKRLIAYVIWLYRNADQLDDCFMEAVKKQVEQLNLQPLIEKYMNKSMPPQLDHSDEETLKEKKKRVETKLRSEMMEKDSIEEQLSKLMLKKKELEAKGLNGQKDLVLLNKEQRRLENIQHERNELQKIRDHNMQEHANAKKKFIANYNESRNIREIMTGDANADDFDDFAYDDSDFMSHSDMEKIEEVEEEYEQGNIDNKIEDIQKELVKKTSNIQQLQEELKETTKRLNFDLSVSQNNQSQYDDDIDATSYDTPFNISEIEDSDNDAEAEEEDTSLGAAFEKKIIDLETYPKYFIIRRCINGLGEDAYLRAYQYVTSNTRMAQDDMRAVLTGNRNINIRYYGRRSYWILASN